MRVPLTVNDFLYRAEAVSADAVALVDEPVQPAGPVPTTTYGELLTRIRAWQAGRGRPGWTRWASARTSGSPW
jgi:fatty-acyl-CoA synthase